jgi:hypothetical protein
MKRYAITLKCNITLSLYKYDGYGAFDSVVTVSSPIPPDDHPTIQYSLDDKCGLSKCPQLPCPFPDNKSNYLCRKGTGLVAYADLKMWPVERGRGAVPGWNVPQLNVP